MRSVNTNCVTDLAKYGPIFLFPFQALKTVFFKLDDETLLLSRVPEIPEIDNESAGNEYGPVYLSGAP